jgi:heme-degrading monooxygenase HmoA
MKPPYYAVIFTSTLKEAHKGYEEEAEKILALAEKQKGFLGFESAREKIGISISYWESLEDIQNWKNQLEHLMAQEKGKSDWYASYRVRIAKVEREYSMRT